MNAAQIWEHIDTTGGPGACWTWQMGRTLFGYGRVKVAGLGERKAHRYVWELTNGPIPHGMLILHRCDVPPCVNPSHLFLGTHADNMADMHAKGRHPSYWGLRTHCSHGHPWNEANTYWNKKGFRSCRACARDRHPRKPFVHRMSRRTHCQNGHEYTEANTGRSKEGWRICRACDRERHKARYWTHAIAAREDVEE